MKIKRSFILFLVFTMLISLCSSAYAANFWKIPDNVRIVQKDNTDNVRIFSSIQAAINSITDASSTNRYRITIKPGIYNEAITMKSFVDIVGSGPINTIITSSVAETLMMPMGQSSWSAIRISVTFRSKTRQPQ